MCSVAMQELLRESNLPKTKKRVKYGEGWFRSRISLIILKSHSMLYIK